MTLKKSFTTTDTVSLKALRALWKELSVVGAGLAGIFVQGMKHASAEDDDDPTGFQKTCRDTDEYYANAAAHDFKDGWGE